MCADRAMERVVGLAGERHRLRRWEILRRRRRMGDDLQIDPGLVHLADAPFAEIAQPLDPMRPGLDVDADRLFGLERRNPEMLFDGDDFAHARGSL